MPVKLINYIFFISLHIRLISSTQLLFIRKGGKIKVIFIMRTSIHLLLTMPSIFNESGLSRLNRDYFRYMFQSHGIFVSLKEC